MITVSNLSDRYLIRHVGSAGSKSKVCVIPKDFLPHTSIVHLASLAKMKDQDARSYPLNKIQDKEADQIFQKILNEQDSTYIFSDHLLKTYLIELIHFITKIHHQVSRSSSDHVV